MITLEFKNKILSALSERRATFGGSDSKFATSLGISPAQFSRIMKGDTERVLSSANWITIARKLGVSLSNEPEWRTANTPVFHYISAQLEKCQKESISALLCDLSDIGKTFTAQHYVKTQKNAIYVDCSQVKSKQKLIRYIAKEFGVGSTGKYSDYCN
jgi:transcriptional regulator with XRE-family HTH domain